MTDLDEIKHAARRRLSWNQPICELDWINREGKWEETDAGWKLSNLRVPVRIVAEHVTVERCSFCGHATIFGAYVRVDPATVPFPAFKDE